MMVTIFRFVDIYTLNSQNLTAKYLNATYHHSRLMGVSDIYNSVSHTARYLSMMKTTTREINLINKVCWLSSAFSVLVDMCDVCCH